MKKSLETGVLFAPMVGDKKDPLKGGLRRKLGGKIRRSKVFRRSAFENLATLFPILGWLPEYKFKEDFPKDVIAGFTVGTLAVPQALGYAVLADVAPVFGLYTSFIAPLIYSLMGTSRHVSVGVFALVCLMTGEVTGDILDRQALIRTRSNGTLDGELSGPEIVSTLAFMIGFWQIFLGIFGLGFLAVYLSDRVVQGFACGASFHILCTQLKWICGVTLRKRSGLFTVPLTLMDFCLMLPYVHLVTCVISLLSLTALLTARFLNANAKVIKIIRFPIPMELLVIAFGSTASYFLDLRTVYSVDIIQTVPIGMPDPRFPAFKLLPEIAGQGFVIAVISFSAAISCGRIFAQKHNYAIDSQQELRALGVVNLVGSFFQCLPSGVALARSAVQEAAGCVTQIASIISASLIFLMITVLGPSLEPVPKACLGCIVLLALWPILLKITEVVELWKISKLEALIFLVPCVSIIILDVEIGLAIGVLFSLFAGVILRTQFASVQLMPPAVSRKAELSPDFEPPSSSAVSVIRINGPLYFANAEICSGKIRKLLRPTQLMSVANESLLLKSEAPDGSESPANEIISVSDHSTPGCSDPGDCGVDLIQTGGLTSLRLNLTKFVILDMVAVTFIDMTGVQMMKKLKKDYSDGIRCRLILAACSEPVKQMLIVNGKYGDLPAECFYDSVCGALGFLARGELE